MTEEPSIQPIAENLWLIAYPLKMLGADLRRNVTIVRLSSGKLLIHSTAPFSADVTAAIKELGEPGWLLDGILRHDTFAEEGRTAFPDIPYLAPEGFSEVVGFPTLPIIPAPMEWNEELVALEIAGAPDARDTALLHVPSRTLILTELIFNFHDDEPLWTELLLKVAVGGEHAPGVPRPVKHGVKDEAAFKNSLETILLWDFDRIIMGHGDVIETDGKSKLRAALEAAEFC
ncbi:hypothetical protein FEM03_01630 [Phragmitibacter flavus]|uniref:DUF4336 domain-containing protein n=1 Tax=Phragmitibacter flavus TaxID=2576071 RepID=A0A5R8KKE7_9BACT|nr:hypothetical protein [Phragmitibacter flavus]TLD72798.1 hypothetical protein FEM03_01630 [Phragmitibacter flavus]